MTQELTSRIFREKRNASARIKGWGVGQKVHQKKTSTGTITVASIFYQSAEYERRVEGEGGHIDIKENPETEERIFNTVSELFGNRFKTIHRNDATFAEVASGLGMICLPFACFFGGLALTVSNMAGPGAIVAAPVGIGVATAGAGLAGSSMFFSLMRSSQKANMQALFDWVESESKTEGDIVLVVIRGTNRPNPPAMMGREPSESVYENNGGDYFGDLLKKAGFEETKLRI